MNAAADQEERDQALTVLLEELYSVPIAEQQRSHWVMDGEMWQMLYHLFAPLSLPVALPAPRGDGLTMLGLPVELRAGAEGARLELSA